MMKNFRTISIESTVGEAVEHILSGSESVFIVTDQEGRFAGIVSLPRILNVLKERGKDVLIRDYLETGMRNFTPNQKLSTAYYYVQQHRGISCPVIEDGKPIGLINNAKINEYIMIQSALSY